MSETLNARQEKALAALLSCSTVEQAAEVAGVGITTLRRYLHEPEFLAAYRDARRDIVNHATTQLQRACGVAVVTLVQVAGDVEATAGARVSAARAILETSIKAVEIDDLAARLDEVESAIKQQQEAERSTPRARY